MSKSTARLSLFPLILLIIFPLIHADPRKLDDVSGDVKCGSCVQTPPPPPPACPPPPPPPSPPPPPPPSTPSCPPPPTQKPPCSSCVPSQGQGIIYVLSPPGSLYPIDSSDSEVRRGGFPAGLVLVIGALMMLLQ